MQKHRLFRFGISGAILAAALLSPGHASAQGNYYTCDFKTNDLATLGYTVLDTNATARHGRPRLPPSHSGSSTARESTRSPKRQH